MKYMLMSSSPATSKASGRPIRLNLTLLLIRPSIDAGPVGRTEVPHAEGGKDSG